MSPKTVRKSGCAASKAVNTGQDDPGRRSFNRGAHDANKINMDKTTNHSNCLEGKRRGLTSKGAESNSSVDCMLTSSTT